jgi:phosphocarrier protein
LVFFKCLIESGSGIVYWEESWDVQQRSGCQQLGWIACEARYFLHTKGKRVQEQHWGERNERRINPKSLLGLLSLGIVKGSGITIIADGADEEAAVNALVDLISSDFMDA